MNWKGIRCFPEETLQVWALCKGASSYGDSPGKHLLRNKPKDWPKGQQTSDDVGVSPSSLWQWRLSFPLENPNHTHCYFHDLSWVLRWCQELLGRWRPLDEMWLSWKVLLLFGLRWGSLLENKPARGTVSPQTEKEPNAIVQLICMRVLLILGIAGVDQFSLLCTVWVRALLLAPRKFIKPGLPFSLQRAFPFSLSCLFLHSSSKKTLPCPYCRSVTPACSCQ